MKASELFDAVRRQFPTATLNSAYRAGDPGEHGAGMAVDLGGPMAAINRWIAQMYPESHELIYTPGINLFNGRPHTYDAATQAGHRDHVHWARGQRGKGVLDTIMGSIGNAFNWVRDKVTGLYDSATNPLRESVRRLFPQEILPHQMARGGVDSMLSTVRDKLMSEADIFGGDPQVGGAPTGDQLSNARIIATVAKALGFGRNGLIVALATALQESGLRNISYGDRDSAGLFQ